MSLRESTQAKVARHKLAHPEKFCPEPRCLWHTGDGRYCPRHARSYMPKFSDGDKVRFLLKPSGHGGLAEVVTYLEDATGNVGVLVAVRTVPEGRYVAVPENELKKGWD